MANALSNALGSMLGGASPRAQLGGGGDSDFDKLRLKMMLQQYLKQNEEGHPVYSPLQGVAEALRQTLSGYQLGEEERSYDKNQKDISQANVDAFSPHVATDARGGPRSDITAQPATLDSAATSLMASPIQEVQQRGVAMRQQQMAMQAQLAQELAKREGEKKLDFQYDPATQGAIESARNPGLIARDTAIYGAHKQADYQWDPMTRAAIEKAITPTLIDRAGGVKGAEIGAENAASLPTAQRLALAERLKAEATMPTDLAKDRYKTDEQLRLQRDQTRALSEGTRVMEPQPGPPAPLPVIPQPGAPNPLAAALGNMAGANAGPPGSPPPGGPPMLPNGPQMPPQLPPNIMQMLGPMGGPRTSPMGGPPQMPPPGMLAPPQMPLPGPGGPPQMPPQIPPGAGPLMPPPQAGPGPMPQGGPPPPLDLPMPQPNPPIGNMPTPGAAMPPGPVGPPPTGIVAPPPTLDAGAVPAPPVPDKMAVPPPPANGARLVMENPKALSNLDPNDPHDAAYIKAIANYRVPPPSASRNPEQRMAVLQAVLSVNPDYNETRYGQASAAMKAFGSGKQGDIARSLGVGIAHLGTMEEMVSALNNGNVGLFNTIGNEWAKQTGKPAPTNFDTAKTIVGNEVAKAIVGGSNAQQDREEAQAAFSKARSPAQLAGAIQTVKNLMGGQLEGLAAQYKRSTGATDFYDTFLNEKTRSQLHPGGASPAAAGAHPELPPGFKIIGQ